MIPYSPKQIEQIKKARQEKLNELVGSQTSSPKRRQQMTPTQLFIKEMRDRGKELKRMFKIYWGFRGKEQEGCPICGVDLCLVADEIESKLKAVEEEKETIWLIEVEREFAEENFSFVLRQPIEPTKEEVIEYCKVNECVTLDPSYCRIRITTPDKTAK